YKEGIKGKDKLENRLAWIRQIIEAQQDTDDVEEIVRTIKSDLAPEDCFAFTPKGDMITLPTGATVVDFAYAIHTEVGNKMKGAKVDGKLVSLDHVLNTGEIVEIITSSDPSHGPNRQWLNICKTNEAKSKIRSWFKKERREENIVNGKAEIEREFARNGINVPTEELQTFLADDMKRHNCSTLDDFYAAVGYGGVILSRIIPRLKDNYNKLYTAKAPTTVTAPVQTHKSGTGIIVDGQSDLMVKYSQCCHPVPGDDIIGFITRGHGISVHRRDCDNYLSALRKGDELDRWIEVRWSSDNEKNSSPSFKVTLDIVAYSNQMIVPNISTVFAEQHIPMTSLNIKSLKNGNTSVIVDCSIAGMAQLNNLISKLKKVPDVINVERTGK
ncbi:MAG: TGS domain-containing protein, partial [Oscillospiraceae bacterium]